MIEMSVESVRASPSSRERVVVLKEKGTERCLPIWIDAAEADALGAMLRHVPNARPVAHDLLCSIVAAAGGAIDFVCVSELKGDVFYSTVGISTRGRRVEVDCRPSDALAVAIKAGAPIYVEETVLLRACIIMDAETGKPVSREKTGGGVEGENISEDEIRRMSAFQDFVEKLDLSDLDEHES